MGTASSNLNEAMAIIEAARSETKQSKLDTLMSQKFEIPTSKGIGTQLQDSKTKSVTDFIKKDSVSGLMKLLNTGTFHLNGHIGQLQLGLLHVAVHFGSRAVLLSLVQNQDIEINVRNVDGDTPLMLSILSSETDARALWICRTLAQNKLLSVAKKNGNTNFPIIASIRKGFKETSKFLISPQFIPEYTVADITVTIKIALRFHEDEVLETICENIGEKMLFEIFHQISHKSQLYLLAHSLEKTMISNRIHKKDTAIGSSLSMGHSTMANVDEKTSEDVGENTLKVGDYVQTLSVEAIKRLLPPEDRSKDAEISRISNQKAIIHNILDDKLYVELIEANCMAVIKSRSVILTGEGKSLKLDDESCVTISSFCHVIDNEDQLRDLQGEKWKLGMEETCGKTGRIVRISKDDTIQVQFAWGSRFHYNPRTLLSSTSDKAESRDNANNWLRKGCPVRVVNKYEKFAALQDEVGLPNKGPYIQIVGKLAQLGAVKIKPFAVQKIVSIIWKGEEFNVNVSAIALISHGTDFSEQKVNVGDIVVLRTDATKLIRELQTPAYGGWSDSVLECQNTKGVVKDIRVNGQFDAASPMLKVEFSTGSTFYFNPKCLALLDQTSHNKKRLAEIRRDCITCTDKLGEGGFGSVYKGTWVMENGKVKTVAIKQMNYGVTSCNNYEDVLKEAKIQSELRHPNIVRLYGISYGEQVLWLVMKIVTGRDLLSLLFPPKGHKKLELPFKYKVKICMDMTHAIAFIHDRGYLHADIKPQNMMVDQRTGNLYICDFGITRYLGTMDLQVYATKFTESFGGTLLYVAPECLKQDKEGRYVRPTFKSDIWSLGATFYEIFTEKHLFDDSMLCLTCKTTNDSEYVQRLVAYHAPKEVRNIIKKTLDFAPIRRPHANNVSTFFHSL